MFFSLSDGWMDCIDACPTDPKKWTASLCGCFVSDINYLGYNSNCTTTAQCCASTTLFLFVVLKK